MSPDWELGHAPSPSPLGPEMSGWDLKASGVLSSCQILTSKAGLSCHLPQAVGQPRPPYLPATVFFLLPPCLPRLRASHTPSSFPLLTLGFGSTPLFCPQMRPDPGQSGKRPPHSGDRPGGLGSPRLLFWGSLQDRGLSFNQKMIKKKKKHSILLVDQLEPEVAVSSVELEYRGILLAASAPMSLACELSSYDPILQRKS